MLLKQTLLKYFEILFNVLPLLIAMLFIRLIIICDVIIFIVKFFIENIQ